jgi:hypothetical protein
LAARHFTRTREASSCERAKSRKRIARTHFASLRFATCSLLGSSYYPTGATQGKQARSHLREVARLHFICCSLFCSLGLTLLFKWLTVLGMSENRKKLLSAQSGIYSQDINNALNALLVSVVLQET